MPEQEETRHRLVTHHSQLKPPRPPRTELVVIPEIEIEDPDLGPVAAAFLVYQMTAADVQKHTRNLQNEDMNWQLSLLSIAVRDNHNKPLWKSAKEAIEQLGQYPQSAITKLLAAYDKVNGPQDLETVEGNSEGTQNGSTPSDTPENSDTAQPTSS